MARPCSFSLSVQFPVVMCPRVAVVSLIAFVGVCWLDSPASADERLDDVLQSWVAGAADVEPPSLATARARFGRKLSAHQLESAINLWAPKSVDALTSQFDWTLDLLPRNQMRLTGIPRDEVDRAFIGTVRVLWHSERQRPISIAFDGVDQSIQFATIRRTRAEAVNHVAFYQEAAESGAEAIVTSQAEVRTASATIGDSVTGIELPIMSIGVNEILDRWEAATATNGPWQIEGERFCYDESFAVETRSYIMLRSDGAGTYEIRFDPMEVDPGTLNEQKRGFNGEPYEVRPDVASTTVVAPLFTIIADPVAQTLHRIDNAVFDEYEWYKRPLHEPGWPSLIRAVDADELREHFRWTVTRRTEDAVWLQAIPSNSDVALCVSKVEVILSANDFRPTAIRDTWGGNEQVVVIHQRSTPAGLTSEIILAGYEGYSEGPTKDDAAPVPQQKESSHSKSPSVARKWFSIIRLCL